MVAKSRPHITIRAVGIALLFSLLPLPTFSQSGDHASAPRTQINNGVNRSRASGFPMIPSASCARPGYAGR
jgi:hypothetical protein